MATRRTACPLCSESDRTVIKQLPENQGEFEYRIKSISEVYERVARESELTKG